MKSYLCACNNRVFFENTQCVSCLSELGWCPSCASIRSLVTLGDGRYQCSHASCGVNLVKCQNYAKESVCNRCVVSDVADENLLCDYCRFNDTIPNLSLGDNREKWLRLEQGKRRLLYTLDLLRLPYGNAQDGIEPELSFDFKGDIIPERKWWWAMSKEERIYTGHAHGKITINIKEADHVEREKARVSFSEAHRTIIGHFRHEVGHYYWDMLVRGQCEEACVAVFGDHNNPPYSEALNIYYAEGPPADWQQRYVSSYATMHPWEDFAECFATYLDMISVLDTAFHTGFVQNLDVRSADLPFMVDQYARLGVMFNEMNRAMGLLDLVPEVIAPAIMRKFQFLHDLLRGAARG